MTNAQFALRYLAYVFAPLAYLGGILAVVALSAREGGGLPLELWPRVLLDRTMIMVVLLVSGSLWAAWEGLQLAHHRAHKENRAVSGPSDLPLLYLVALTFAAAAVADVLEHQLAHTLLHASTSFVLHLFILYQGMRAPTPNLTPNP